MCSRRAFVGRARHVGRGGGDVGEWQHGPWRVRTYTHVVADERKLDYGELLA
jgi:hypothetical protein